MTRDKFDSIKAKDSLGKNYILRIKGESYDVRLYKIELTKECKTLFFYSNDDSLLRGSIKVNEHGKYSTFSYKDVHLIEN